MTADSGFAQPSSGGGYFDSKNHVGHLILFTTIHEVYHNPTNVYKGKAQPRDEAKVDLVDLNGDGMLRTRVIVTHPGIVNRLTPGARNVLGRVSQKASADDPESFYYALDGYNDEDVPLAKSWVEAFDAGRFGQPAAAQGQGASQAPAQTPQNAPSGAPSGQPPWANTQGQGSGAQTPVSGPPQGQPAWQQAQVPPQSAPPATVQGQQIDPAIAQQLAGMDPAALAALMQGLGATPVQQQPPQTPPY